MEATAGIYAIGSAVGAMAGSPASTFFASWLGNKWAKYRLRKRLSALIMLRGVSTLCSKLTTADVLFLDVVQLPAYVGALCPGADFTVQLTPIYDGTIRNNMLYASEVDPATNSFRVYGENGRFNWLVHGKRFDIEVEPNKADVNRHGDGPYTYLTQKE